MLDKNIILPLLLKMILSSEYAGVGVAGDVEYASLSPCSMSMQTVSVWRLRRATVTSSINSLIEPHCLSCKQAGNRQHVLWVIRTLSKEYLGRVFLIVILFRRMKTQMDVIIH